MSNPVGKSSTTPAWKPASAGDKAVWVQQLTLAVLAAIFVCVAGPGISMAVAIAFPIALFLLLGPSRPMLAVFLVYMIASHQYISFKTLSLFGVEWHPRELLLSLLLAHWTIKALRRKIRLEPDPLHLAFALYAGFFVFAAVTGLLAQNNVSYAIGECRYPVFLISYVVFASLIQNTADLRFYVRIMAGLTLAIAVSALGYFAYAMLSGNLVQLNQTPFGEIMKTYVGPILVQTVRPNGHMFFEVGIVIAVGLLVCPETTRHRRISLAVIILVLGLAVLITTMRTAYATLAVSLGLLMFLLLPNKRLQLIIVLLSVALFLVVFALLQSVLSSVLAEILPRLDFSLQGRLVEIAGAFQKFLESPVVGAGMGSTFQGLQLVQSGEQLAAGEAEYQTIHNVWMYFLFKGGFIGILLALCGLGGILARGYALIQTVSDSRERFFLCGLVAAFGGQLVASLAMPRLTYPSGHVFVALMCCAFLVYARTWHSEETGDRRL